MKHVLIITLMILVPLSAWAKPGDLDTGFATNGVYFPRDYDNSSFFRDIITLEHPDPFFTGNIIGAGVYSLYGSASGQVTGSGEDTMYGDICQDFPACYYSGFKTINLEDELGLTRIADGIDPAEIRLLYAGIYEIAETGLNDSYPSTAAVSTIYYYDPKRSTTFNTSSMVIAKYTLAGYLDTTFGLDGNKTGAVVIDDLYGADLNMGYALKIQSDGKILATGDAWNNGSYVSAISLVRLNSDGNYDTSFGENSNGKVVSSADGYVLTGDVLNDMRNGHAFHARSMVLQADGKIIVSGFYTIGVENQTVGHFAARYLENGTLDASFGENGLVLNPLTIDGVLKYTFNYESFIQSDGKIIFFMGTPQANGKSFTLIRLHSDGTPDTTYGTNGIVQNNINNSTAKSAVLQADDKIILGGYSGSDAVLARLSSDGSFDTGFGVNGIAVSNMGLQSASIEEMTLDANNYIVVSGQGSPDGSASKLIVARFLNDVPMPTIALDLASDSGRSNTDFLTNDTTPTFSGTAQPGTTVTLWDNNMTSIGSAETIDGMWSITASVLSAGTHVITAKASNAVDNESPMTEGIVLTLDVDAPTGYGLAFSQGTYTTADGAFSLNGAEIGTSFDYTISSGGNTGLLEIIQGHGNVVDSAQSVSVTNLQYVSDGLLTLRLSLVDSAGNRGVEVVDTATLESSGAPTIETIFDDVHVPEESGVLILPVVTGDVDGDTRLTTVTVSDPTLVDAVLTASWQQLGSDIDAKAAGEMFGTAVAMSSDGRTVAVGVPKDAQQYAGVRIYAYNGTAWVQQGGDIEASVIGDFSGLSVSLSDDGATMALGAPYSDVNGIDSGEVRIYHYDGVDWTQQGGSIEGESAGDRNGYTVSLNSDGSTVAMGAPGNDNNGDNSGQVRVYSFNGTQWLQRGSDIDGEQAGDANGNAVSLSNDGSTVATGSPYDGEKGHARVFSYDGSAWVQQGGNIEGEAVNDFSGYSVSLSGDGTTMAMGSMYNDNKGHVQIFVYNGLSWLQKGEDIDGDVAGGYSGISAALSKDGNTVAIGAIRVKGVNGSLSGRTRIFVYDGSAWVQQGGNIDGEAANDFSGWSVSLSRDGRTVAIGAPYNEGNGTSGGHVRIFTLSESLALTPKPGVWGNSTVTVTVSDGRSESNATFNYTVSEINHAPTASNITLDLHENIARTFAADDFNFSDTNSGDTLDGIYITSLPSSGLLQLSGTGVTLEEYITAADISNLVYTPAADSSGSPYDLFGFKVNDGESNSTAAYTATVNVAATSSLISGSGSIVTGTYPTHKEITGAQTGALGGGGTKTTVVIVNTVTQETGAVVLENHKGEQGPVATPEGIEVRETFVNGDAQTVEAVAAVNNNGVAVGGIVMTQADGTLLTTFVTSQLDNAIVIIDPDGSVRLESVIGGIKVVVITHTDGSQYQSIANTEGTELNITVAGAQTHLSETGIKTTVPVSTTRNSDGSYREIEVLLLTGIDGKEELYFTIRQRDADDSVTAEQTNFIGGGIDAFKRLISSAVTNDENGSEVIDVTVDTTAELLF